MRIITIFSSLFAVVPLLGGINEIHSSLLIHDNEGALKYSKSYFLEEPDLLDRKFIYAQTLAQLLRTQEALNLVKMEDICPKNAFELIESLAWSILRKHAQGGEASEAMSLLGAAMTRDIRGLKILLEKGRSPNAKIRGFALRLAAYYPDPPLKKLVARLITSETNYNVRLEAIRAAGQQSNKEAIEPLKKIIEHPLSTSEERLHAIHSLAAILEGIDPIQLQYLLQNGRAQYRALALESIIRDSKKEYIDQVKEFLTDPSLDVRYKAFEALALLSDQKEMLVEAIPLIQKSSLDTSLPLQMMGNWILSLTNHQESIDGLVHGLTHESDGIRSMSACFIAKSKPALDFLEANSVTSTDPFVKINLALGYLRHKTNLQFVKETLREFLHNEMNLVMFSGEEAMFSAVVPSKVTHQPMLPNYPLIVDQLARLSLIGSYALVDLEGAKRALAQLLEKKLVPVSKMALMLLFKESDADVVEVAKELIQTGDKKNRLQLLLVLAFFGKETSISGELMELYPNVTFEEKLQIVESLGYLGGDETVQFLIKKLEEPSRLIQIAAASSLIQSLYH
ncbi:MAG: HEAT repeat domain-containing protein [Chlamydiia bacterium]